MSRKRRPAERRAGTLFVRSLLHTDCTVHQELPMAVVLDDGFYERPALDVARDLLGKYLVRRVGRRQVAAVIYETEAYIGPHDLACHASKGCTGRTEVMFGPAGRWYVYFIYGVHWMLNVVTDQPGY